jgi:hypothetical protein
MLSKKVIYNIDLLRHILSYIIIPKYKLLNWIEELFNENNSIYPEQLYKLIMNNYIESYDYLTNNYNNINWVYLSSNIYAIDLLNRNIDKIEWSHLSNNPNSLNILQKYFDKIDWHYIVYNEKGIDIIRNNLDKITNFIDIGYNINAIDIIEKHFDKIHIAGILSNKNAIYLQKYENFILKYSNFIITDKYVKNNKYQKDNTINMHIWKSFFLNQNIHIILEKYEEYLNWKKLLKNYYFGYIINYPNMYPFILRNYEKIGYDYISYCESPQIVNILENNIDKINWSKLSKNCNNDAIRILHNNIDKIDWYALSRNPCNEAIILLKKFPNNIKYDKLIYNTNLEGIRLFYNYYKSNIKSKIDKSDFNNWINHIIPSNKDIFIKDDYKTNKYINEIIEDIVI